MNKSEVKKFWETQPMDYGTEDFYELDEIYFNSYKPDIPTGMKVLEVGCGFGSMLNTLSVYNNAIGLDLSTTCVNVCKKRGLNVIQGDAENLPFPDNHFDFVYSWGVLHHTPNIQKAIDEIHRVLKTSGKTIVMLYHNNSIMAHYHILFKKGICKGELFYRDADEIIRRYTDKGGPPISKTYSKRRAKELFNKFLHYYIYIKPIEGELENFPCSKFKIGLPKWMGERWGWFLIVEAVK